MAGEWVAPAATAVTGSVGVFFTWLTGHQGRRQADRVALRAEARAERERSMTERRNAYFATLRITRLDVQRLTYQSGGDSSKLAEMDRTWPKGERIRMAAEAEIALDAFGSPAARAWQEQSHQLYAQKDAQQMRRVYEELVEIVRRELGSVTPGDAL